MTYVNEATLDGSCGVSVLYSFRNYIAHYEDNFTVKNVHIHGGAGIVTALFVVGDTLCDSVKEDMLERFDLLYQTPAYFNMNSGNRVVFAVFKTREGEFVGNRDEDEGEEDDYDE